MFASRLAVFALAALLVMDHAVAQSHATPDDPIVYEVRHEMVGGISNTPADCSLVDASVRGLTAIIEPLLIIFLGIVILIVALAILLPYWNIGELVE